MKHTFLKSGFFRTSNKNEKAGNEISLTNWLKRSLKYLGLPYVDPCCDPRDNVPISFNTDTDKYQEWDSANQEWIDSDDVTMNNLTLEEDLAVSHISSYDSDPTIFIYNPFVLNTDSGAINVTNTATVDEVIIGRITSTSAAAVTITLPTATALATALSAVRGTRFQFMIDNSAGANTVTLDLTGTGITTGTVIITGQNSLSISVANSIALFELCFTSTTTAIIRRLY